VVSMAEPQKGIPIIMKKILLLFTVILLMGLMSVGVSALADPTRFVKTYGESSDEVGNSIIQTSDGGYAIAGQTASFGAGGVWVLKLDADGNVVFEKTFGDSSFDKGVEIIEASNGDLVVLGDRRDSETNIGISWVARLDSAGYIIWETGLIRTRIFRFSYRPQAMVQTADGGFLVASSEGGRSAPTLSKLDANGTVLFQQRYAFNLNFIGPRILGPGTVLTATSDGGAAFSSSFTLAGGDISVVRVDENGSVVFAKQYGGNLNDRPGAIVQTSDGGFAVVGTTDSFSGVPFLRDVWVLKLDADGNVQFENTYGGLKSEFGNSIVQTSDGGYAIAGQTASFGAGSNDVWVLKLDSSLNVQFEKAYGGLKNEVGHSIVQTADGGYAIAGQTASFGAGSNDVWVLKLDSNGNAPASCTISPDTSASVTPTNAGVLSIVANFQPIGEVVAIFSTGVPSSSTVQSQCPSVCTDTITQFSEQCDPPTPLSISSQCPQSAPTCSATCQCVLVCIDPDGDGFGNFGNPDCPKPDIVDQCPTVAGSTLGCSAGLRVSVQEADAKTKPASFSDRALTTKVFSSALGSCADTKGIKPINYEDIFNNCAAENTQLETNSPNKLVSQLVTIGATIGDKVVLVRSRFARSGFVYIGFKVPSLVSGESRDLGFEVTPASSTNYVQKTFFTRDSKGRWHASSTETIRK